MRKKALCVGINDYPYNGADLNGCVSDARAWASLLIDHYDFQSLDVKLLTDNQATKSKIIEELKSLTAGTETGDVLFFSISSHGTYLSDAGGDETGYAEAFCPYDCANDLIMIEEVYDIFKDIVKSVHLTIVLDTSFSGTITRSGISEFIPGLRTPDDRRVRFLSPALMGTRVLINPWKAQPKKKKSVRIQK